VFLFFSFFFVGRTKISLHLRVADRQSARKNGRGGSAGSVEVVRYVVHYLVSNCGA
jgi:hypothetical protein